MSRTNKLIKTLSDEICIDLDDYFTGYNQVALASINANDYNINTKYLKDEQILEKAIKYMFSNDLHRFKKILEKNIRVINRMSDRGVYLIHLACYNKKHEFISFLLLMKADPNKKDHIGKHAQHYAVMSEDTLTIYLLISYGADFNVCDLDGDTPLHYAVSNNNSEVITTLINNNVDPLIKNKKNLLSVDYSISNTEILLQLSDYIDDYIKYHN
jgi:ankyrin repeat protein